MTDIVERLEALIVERESLRMRVKELEEDVEKWNAIASQIRTDWIPANKKLSAELVALKAGQVEPVGYQRIFDAIAKATAKEAVGLAVSVRAFKESIGGEIYTSAPTIPEGWQLVPVEPTDDMLLAYTGCKTVAGERWAKHQWESMLSVAPKPGKPA